MFQLLIKIIMKEVNSMFNVIITNDRIKLMIGYSNQLLTPERISQEKNPKYRFIATILAPIWNFCISYRISPFWPLFVLLITMFYFIDLKSFLRNDENFKPGMFFSMLFASIVTLIFSIITQVNLITKGILF